MDKIIKAFIEKINVIKNLNPKRREPGDGSDGYCDCIGLIIGAIRRMGLKWSGIHGSNWAARKELVKLKKINSVSDLKLGDMVLKARAKGSSGWDLPKRYQPGGKYYNGDLNDYYHVGAVTQLNPLNITHMSSKVTVDTKLGKWSHHGTIKILEAAGGGWTEPDPGVVPSTGSKAVVVADSGRYVKMRKEPSTRCRLYDEIPVGATVTLEKPGEEWAQISYGTRKNWYMMAKFLDVIGDGKGKY